MIGDERTEQSHKIGNGEPKGSNGKIAACFLATATLVLHLHQSIHGHHVVVQMSHDDHRSEYNETNNKNAKGERENIVGLVRRA